MRVQSRAGRGDQVHRDWHVRVFRLRFLDVAGHAVDQHLVRGPEVRAARIAGVIAGACRGGTRAEISGRGKWLADQMRADNLSVHCDEVAIRLPGEENLREARYYERVDQAQQNRRYNGHQDRSYEVLFHRSFLETNPLSQAQCRVVMIISISLIPMNGAMIPPTP